MSTQSAMQETVRQLGNAMGLGDVALDAQGACALQFDENFIVGIQCNEAEDELWLHADLGVAGSPQTYQKLLRANLFGRGTGGATLSLTSDEPPRIVLARTLDWRAEGTQALLGVLEGFVNSVEDWTATLRAEPG